MSNVIALDGSMVGVEDGIMDEAAVQLVSYPNPFNPAVTIKINVKCKMKNVKCKIYNTGGRIVKDLSKELKGTTRGVNHAIVWRGDDSFGRPVGSGVYFLRFTNGKTIRQLKLVLAK
jgi:flagellar hook assembly protein FlgD